MCRGFLKYERAEYIQDFIDSANQNIGYEYDRYMEFGTSSFANVVTEYWGSKKECILWSVNHYLSLNRNIDVIEKAVNTLRKYCDRIAARIKDNAWSDIASELSVTISLGLSDLANNNTAASLLTTVKEGLDLAKQDGGHQIVVG